MQKLFIPEYDGGEKIYLNEEQSRHLAKSLRMKAGDMITVCSGTGEDYGCMIEEAGKDGVVLSVCYKKQARANRVLRFLFIRACPRAIKWKILFKNAWSSAFTTLPPCSQSAA